MATKTKRRSLLRSLATVFLACVCLLLVVLGAIVMTSRVSGTATLPNGIVAQINGPFSASTVSSTTEIEAGGHIFAFSPNAISIDGVPVGQLDEAVQKVQIDATAWNASLRVNGAEMTKRR